MAQMALRIVVPEDLEFGDLQLSRDPTTREVSFAWSAIERLCAASGLETSLFLNSPESLVAGLIVTWYRHHRARGGESDAVAEQLIAEAEAEKVFGAVHVQPGGSGAPQ